MAFLKHYTFSFKGTFVSIVTQTWVYIRKAVRYWMTDNLSKPSSISFVWKLKRKDSWGISDSNLLLRQYASTTCMSQMIIYSLLSVQNIWINSCECFGLHEVQQSTCMSSMHEFALFMHVFASATDPITNKILTCLKCLWLSRYFIFV